MILLKNCQNLGKMQTLVNIQIFVKKIQILLKSQDFGQKKKKKKVKNKNVGHILQINNIDKISKRKPYL